MFLVGRKGCLLAAAFAALAPCLLLPGCAVRIDDSARSERRAGKACAEPAAEGSSSFFGVKRDTEPDAGRVRRAANLAGDPKSYPTPREQRAARALARAEQEIIEKSGGAIMYRPDGSSSKAHTVKFVASAGALTVKYSATERLNRLDGVSHAMLLVVYHMRDRAALDQLAGHEDGMRTLLAGEMFDDAVMSVRKHYIQPGADGTLLLERPENGRFVAIVAGYAEPSARTSLYVAEYGLGQWYAPGTTPMHRRKAMYTPLPMHLLVALDEQSMSVKNTGRIHGGTQKVHLLMAEQVQHMTKENFFWGMDSMSTIDE